MMKKKTLLAILLIAVIGASSIVFFGCNKNKYEYKSLLDYYVNYNEVNEFSQAQKLVELNAGYSLYIRGSESSDQKYTDYGYLDELNAFVLKNDVENYSGYNTLDVVKDGRYLFKGLLDSNNLSINIVQVRYVHGLLAVMSDRGYLGVLDPKEGIWLIKPEHDYLKGDVDNSIDEYLKILSNDFIVTKTETDAEILKKNRFYLYSKTVTNIKYEAAIVGYFGKKDTTLTLSEVYGYENYFVTKTTNANNNDKSRYSIYNVGNLKNIKNAVDKKDNLLKPISSGIIDSTNASSTTKFEFQYFGNGKFLVQQLSKVTDPDKTNPNYTFKTLAEEGKSYDYWDLTRFLIDAKNNTSKLYNSDFVFLTMSNNYDKFNTSDTKVYTSKYLKDGYTYCKLGYTINEDKSVDYDQYIIRNSNFNIELSLTKNYGYSIKSQKEVDELSFYDLLKTFVNGKGFVSFGTSIVKLFDAKGNVIGQNSDGDYLTSVYNAGMIVASKNVLVNGVSKVKFGAMNSEGRVTVPFEYDELSLFVGDYAIGVIGKDIYLVDKSNYKVQLYGSNKVLGYNIATSSTGTGIYKSGVFVSYTEKNDTKLYGLKKTSTDFSKNVILPEQYSNITLYSPNKSFNVVYAACEAKNENGVKHYTIYKLK